MSIKKKLHHLISGQLPEFVRVEYPQFVAFLEQYYKFLEQDNQVHDLLLNSSDWTDIDKTFDLFVNYYRKQFTYDFPDNTILDNRRLIKYINQYYEAKGSETATEMFFRIMFNEKADVEYPGNYLLKNSDGHWYRKKIIKVETSRFPENNIFDLEGKVITLRYLESIEGAGDYERTLTTQCFSVFETSRPDIYQLEVDINPNFQFPDFVAVDTPLASSLGNYDTHIYVQLRNEPNTVVTYGTITKQLVSVAYIQEKGSRFQRDDSYFISEVGVEGDYFSADYTEFVEGPDAYVYELLQNNAIIRVKEIQNTQSSRGQLRRLAIVDTGERFRVRNFGQIISVDVVNGGSGYSSAPGATTITLYGDGNGGIVKPVVVGGVITQVIVETTGSNYTSAVAVVNGAGSGAVLDVNVSLRGEPVRQFTVDVAVNRPGSSLASIVFNTGEIYHAPGEYKDNAGFLSDIVKLQDNDYYQPYSYVIRTTKPLSQWKDIYLNSSHPAGFKMFAELQLEGDIDASNLTVESEIEQITLESL
jgi:hypothetical protein